MQTVWRRNNKQIYISYKSVIESIEWLIASRERPLPAQNDEWIEQLWPSDKPNNAKPPSIQNINNDMQLASEYQSISIRR